MILKYVLIQYFPFPRLLMWLGTYITENICCLALSPDYTPPPLYLALGRADVAPPIVILLSQRAVSAGW